jgi:hypothetical protein
LQLAVAYQRLGSSDQALQTYQRILEFDQFNSIAKQKVAELSGVSAKP